MEQLNQLQMFQNSEFGQLEVYLLNSIPYFPATKCATIIGHTNPERAIREYCKGVTETVTPTSGGLQTIRVIPEGDLYRLIIRSNIPTAEKFERWVFDDVLPSIRKRGVYMTDNALDKFLNDPDTFIKLMTAYKEEKLQKEALSKQVEADKPKVLFANAVSNTNDLILIADLAKMVKANGIEIGQNRLFKWLRDEGYLLRSGDYYNTPSQKSMELGLFKMVEYTVARPDGTVNIYSTPKVTGKGQRYFINKLIINN